MRFLRPGSLTSVAFLIVSGCVTPKEPAAKNPEDYLVPSSGEWRRQGEIRTYTSENLHEYIDGEAPFVVSFGFKKLCRAVYRRPSGAQCTVDLYDMGTPENAFALFRAQAAVEGKTIDIGDEGVSVEGKVEFRSGPFFVDLTASFSEGTEKFLSFARRFARSLPSSPGPPAFLALLPREGRVPRSEAYAPVNFMGYEFLSRTVSAEYKLKNGEEALLFACRFASDAEAAQALQRFKQAMGGSVKECNYGEECFYASDSNLGKTVAFRQGIFVAGATGDTDKPGIKALVRDLQARLGREDG